jgi:hypothetical protein
MDTINDERFVLELNGDAAGVLVRDGSSFVFFAATQADAGLEGRKFASVRDAEAVLRDRRRRYKAV